MYIYICTIYREGRGSRGASRKAKHTPVPVN